MNELVYLKNDEAVCDSLQVAEKFDKAHRSVLRDIDNLIAQNCAVKSMFKQSTYKADKLNALTMCAGTTEVINDGGCNMELTYTVDTQSYVDTKIAEVSKAII